MMGNISKTLLFVLASAACAGVGGCAAGDESSQSGARPTVFVSIEPLRYFAGRIGGDRIEVHVMVAPGQSPATYEPTARQLTELSGARLFFTVGVPMETQLIPRIRRSFPRVDIVDTRDGMKLESAAGQLLQTDQEPGAGEHGHSGTDPHVWLDPDRARIIARTIYEALVRIAPADSGDFSRNYRALERELAGLEKDIAAILAPVRGREMVVFHPAYGYFARAFGLKQVAIEAGGVGPGSKHLAEIIDTARQRGVKAIFVQPEFSSATADAVAAAVGARVVTLDPLAYDYPANMRRMADEIVKALL
jgi:zinc transport system substrate-binding protein